MPRLVRPYIPLAVRVQVAERQLGANGSSFDSLTHRLRTALGLLFGSAKVHLDHDPALENREKVFRNGAHVDYNPSANDPNYLIYREAAAHKVKTLVRGEHGQHSDAALARKRKRMAKRADPKRRIAKIPRRKDPWPKSRRLQSRRRQ